MLRFAIVFLVIALIAACLAFGGVASSVGGGAKVLFFLCLVVAVLTFLGGAFRRRSL